MIIGLSLQTLQLKIAFTLQKRSIILLRITFLHAKYIVSSQFAMKYDNLTKQPLTKFRKKRHIKQHLSAVIKYKPCRE